MSVQNHKKEITLALVLQSSTLVAKTSSIDHRGGSPGTLHPPAIPLLNFKNTKSPMSLILANT